MPCPASTPVISRAPVARTTSSVPGGSPARVTSVPSSLLAAPAPVSSGPVEPMVTVTGTRPGSASLSRRPARSPDAKAAGTTAFHRLAADHGRTAGELPDAHLRAAQQARRHQGQQHPVRPPGPPGAHRNQRAVTPLALTRRVTVTAQILAEKQGLLAEKHTVDHQLPPWSVTRPMCGGRRAELPSFRPPALYLASVAPMVVPAAPPVPMAVSMPMAMAVSVPMAVAAAVRPVPAADFRQLGWSQRLQPLLGQGQLPCLPCPH